ncbi:MAG TPA: prolipoprotein diacylglyceryl transferase [Clostridium sp.]|jgi:phosphatidylglycerol:prolipoprotein diacylglycerol transferase|uniref:Phosphatidylglycerol--prolipoprotein diacylglyceryl transferase n=1 Tax=Clostridium lapidicellarium TaxID=3240931 RepID=A0ABV4DUM0_9CLOT|nr:prolipoprotein diacylglyceryl transferase [uncultured Clostridium sp.]NLU07073.1 prolipoprotein diacylglyceryl transferase [Clostridiales bacterium]HBC96023.1 prolipoprotein diacylglyceryl transferase [Clostridium sp.]
MNPIAFSINGFEIRWYGIIIALGILAAILLADSNCKYKKYNFDILIDVFLVSFPFAIIGARAYYVIFRFQYYKDNLFDMINIRQGGLAIHGGLILGILAAYVFNRYKKLDFIKLLDFAAPSIILAQAIGRWGNFFNSEAHGGPVSYEFISKFPLFIQKGMHIDGVYYHPTFLYESVWNLAVCIILIYILRRKYEKGAVISAYVGLYSFGRFFIEGLRTDSLMLGNIRVAQLVSLIGVTLSIVYLLYLRAKKNKDVSQS